MKNIRNMNDLLALTDERARLNVHVHMRLSNSFILSGRVLTKESLYGALQKIISLRAQNEIPAFDREKEVSKLLSDWVGGGGGFSGGGASGNW